ncbi:helix-hairpin-helix domain-containing protein [Desulfofundulus thermosubterraneus]|uniref:Competence protein ComEA n=1 Tax=Desulfofundulus thermosubterraneus DSM 16057 TaxID=1121432 RepID=A0A1M6AGC1_9FIRM|nr:helix-hairpin-helix domain-containing protein [Desulfofundulus thermosubterraneus]SHI35505.1 competence protein ComEA [Desulfofundulus thermosubterraneus DSM 16057]
MFEVTRRHQLIILIVAAILVFGGGYRYALWQQRVDAKNKPALEQLKPPENLEKKELVVHVAGAVEKPGVYRLPSGARVQDAVQMAVARPEADLDMLNLAAPLADGQKLVVPVKQPGLTGGAVPLQNMPGSGPVNATLRDNPFAQPHGKSPTGSGSLVNINTADQKELETLPGIGPSLAQRIIQYRETNGPFKVPEDIKNVSGIGDKRFEQLKDYITVY